MVESCLAVAGKQMRCCTAKDAPSSVLVDISTKRNSLDGTALEGLQRFGSFNKKKCNLTWVVNCEQREPFSQKSTLIYVYRKILIMPHGKLPGTIFWGSLQVPPNMIEWCSRSKPVSMHTHTQFIFCTAQNVHWTMPWRKSKRDLFEHKMVYDTLILNKKQLKNTLYWYWCLYSPYSFF